MQPTELNLLQLLPIIAAVYLTGSMIIKNEQVHDRGSYHADMLQTCVFSMLL